MRADTFLIWESDYTMLHSQEQEKGQKPPARTERLAEDEQQAEEQRQRWHGPDREPDQQIAVVCERVSHYADQIGGCLWRDVERRHRLPAVRDERQQRKEGNREEEESEKLAPVLRFTFRYGCCLAISLFRHPLCLSYRRYSERRPPCRWCPAWNSRSRARGPRRGASAPSCAGRC